MTLEQWKLCCVNAIRSNFKVRNARVFSCAARHQRIVLSRRAQIRRHIGALRQARDSASAQLVADVVRWRVA